VNFEADDAWRRADSRYQTEAWGYHVSGIVKIMRKSLHDATFATTLRGVGLLTLLSFRSISVNLQIPTQFVVQEAGNVLFSR
jgi:hypothetical protein